ncbi:MAG: isoprenylcysteine carboxylmethyltransferase family protein [Anaerolineae bacterium]|nr:isoprenylcysteine carboxylmethyltransferase family protein [Anaerolineae bacterium]
MANTGFWWILSLVALYGVQHSLLASLGAKALAQRWFGEAGRRYYRLFFIVMAVITSLPLVALPAWLPDARLYAIPMPWLALTRLGQLAGLAILVTGLMQTGMLPFLGLDVILSANKGNLPPHMVTTGMYRWVRHPLYFGSLLIIWLMPDMSWNLLALDIGLTVYLAVGAWFEERKLLVEFGEAYRQYRQRTPMLFPLRFKRSP